METLIIGLTFKVAIAGEYRTYMLCYVEDLGKNFMRESITKSEGISEGFDRLNVKRKDDAETPTNEEEV